MFEKIIKIFTGTSTVIVLGYTFFWFRNKWKREVIVCNKKNAGNENKVCEINTDHQESDNSIVNILLSPESAWEKVGTVKELWFYPLKSGKGSSIKKCFFDNLGISFNVEKNIPLRDRMFLVFDEATGKFITGRQYSKLLLVSICAVNESQVKLEVSDSPSLVFDIVKGNDRNVFNCIMWFGENVKCVDCGPEANKWISRYLTGKDSGLKLGQCMFDSRRVVTQGAWEKHAKLCANLRNEDTGLFSDLASYMLMSEASVDDLNGRLRNPIRAVQFRPNIVIEKCRPYEEDEWEWIRIGNKAIIRNFKLCTRCSMVRVNPETGIPDPDNEPLKTLRTYRKLKDPEMSELENHAPSIGIYCGLYQTGEVRVSDHIYVYRNTTK